MKKLTQENAPVLEALEKLKQMRIVPFDVPGHKRGRGNKVLTEFLGERCLSVDVNSMKPLDNLCHPVSIIKDAEQLAAEAFGAAHAFFMVGGRTSSVQAMILTACKRGDKIILPRNVHRSAINAMILCGAVPIYINPQMDKTLGISLGMSIKDVKKAIADNPDAKAVFVNNPTYYGICTNLNEIIKMAHANNMLVLADEAHGTHFYFNDKLPAAAMRSGADMAAVSLHKSGGSLTQSSMLFINDKISEGYVRQIINLTQTTSGSYLLMSSLDISRRNLALRGNKIIDTVIDLVEYARSEINNIGDYYAYSREKINGDSIYAFGLTTLSIYTRSIGLAGIEVYDILRDEYDIQTEFGDLANLLAYVSIGDRPRDMERWVRARAERRRIYKKDPTGMLEVEYINPKVVLPPQDAFYTNKEESIPLDKACGRVCTEFVMCYPPGIPILAPGELVTSQILEYIHYAKAKGCQMTGPEDMELNNLNVVTEK